MKSKIKIIGGKWRGRKLSVIEVDGLRPTPNRIRETLFNWLAADCPGATVLDCFAGSGALGIEAVSRGAKVAVLLEQQATALVELRKHQQGFGRQAVEIIGGNALDSIPRLTQKFDIVFIDPPYTQPVLRGEVIGRLETRGCLHPGAKIYFEWPRAESFELPSSNLHWLKRKTAATVNYAIAEWRLSG